MAVTRIKNNQITDLTVNAAQKLQDYTVTSAKLANNLTYSSSLTVAGNLTVQGNVTAIDTHDLIVEDPLILLAKDQTGTPTLDIGYIGERGDELNIAMVWDESAGQFVTAFTTDTLTNTTITIDSYASLQTGNLTAGNVSFTGVLDVVGNVTLGNLQVDPNSIIDAGNNKISNVAEPTANSDAATKFYVDSQSAQGFTIEDDTANTTTVSGGDTVQLLGTANEVEVLITNVDQITFGLPANVTISDNLTVTNTASAGAVTATGNITGNNLISNNDVTTATVTASGNVAGGNITTAGAVDAVGNVSGGNITTPGAVDAVGNVAGSNITTSGAVDAVGNVAGGNITTAGAVDATGNVTAGNLVSNNDVTTVTVTASGNVAGGNLTTTGAVDAVGNVAGGNITTPGAVDAVGNVAGGNITTAGEVTATGNVTAGNLVANNDVTTVTVTASGNVSAGNVAATGAVTSATMEATGNITAGNLISNNDVTTTTVTASGNVSAGNVSSAGNIDATANVNAGNVEVVGNVTASYLIAVDGFVANGNIEIVDLVVSGNITANGYANIAGNVTVGNLLSNNLIEAVEGNISGNLSAGNLLSNTIYSGNLSINATGNVYMDILGNVDMNQRWINDLPAPIQGTDAATKQYVDDAVSTGITIHTPVYLETADPLPAATYTQGGTTSTVITTVSGNTVVFTSAINPQVNDQLWFTSSFSGILANTPYFVVSAPNTSAAVLSTSYGGSPVSDITDATGLSQPVRINSGQGATLTGNVAGNLVVDGIQTTAGQRILVYNQTPAYENGVYVVTNAGDVGNAWVLTRSSDMNTYIPDDINGVDAGDYFFIEAGATGAGEAYVMTAPIGPIILGYNSLTFTQFSASSTYSANTQAGLVLNGTIFSAKVDNDTTAFDIQGNIVVKPGANLVSPNIGEATGNSLTLQGNGLLSATTVEATGNVTAGNVNSNAAITSVTVDATGNVTAGNLVSNNDVTTNTVTATGNVAGGNITTPGAVEAVGNVAGGNLTTSGAVDAVGNVAGGNITTAGTVEAVGNVAGGNLTTSGTVDAVGNVSGGNVTTAGTVEAVGNVAGGNLTTSGAVDATGNVTAGNLVSNNDVTSVTVTATGNVSGGNITTTGNVDATGNVAGGNVTTVGEVTAVGNVAGGNITTAGNVDAVGNVAGGNVITTGVVDAATANIAGNITTAGNVIATGNIDAGNANITGNITVGGNISGNITGNITAAGNATQVQYNEAGILAANASFTFDSTGNATLNVNYGNGGTIQTDFVTVTANVTAGNIEATSNITSTAGNVVALAGNIEGNNIVATNDVTTATVTVTGNITAGNIAVTGISTLGNLQITGNDITNPTSNVVTINSAGEDVDFIVSGNTIANLFIVDGGADSVLIGTAVATENVALKVGTTTSMMVPVGNTVQRPATGEAGMLRFNTTEDVLEYYDSNSWNTVIGNFTVIVADDFNGDGSTVTFTLSQDSTTAATIVSINGVVQIPVTAYAVSGNVLTFTEAPEPTDVIDARVLTTTTTATRIADAGVSIIMNPAEGAIDVTGNLIPSANATYTLGNATNNWDALYVSGNTIYLGGLQLKDISGTFSIYAGDGSTPADMAIGNIEVAAIEQGTSQIGIKSLGGDAYVTIGGVPDVLVVTTDGIEVVGNVTATGDVTAQNVNSLSDAALKTNIAPLTGVSSVISQLRGVEYDWRNGSGHSYGFLAHEVEKVLPDAVKTGAGGLKSINYTTIIPFLVETIKQLGDEVAELKKRLK